MTGFFASLTGAGKPTFRMLWAQVNALARAGVDRTSDVVLQRKVVLANTSALIAIVGCLIYACIYVPRGVWGLTASSLLQLALAVCYVAVWSINRRGAFMAARLYFFSITMVLVLGSIVMGQGSLLLSHYVFLLLAIVALIFFNRAEWLPAVVLGLLNAGLFIFFDTFDWPAHASVLAMSPDSIHRIRVLKVATCITVLMLLMLLTEFTMASYVRQLDMLGRTDVLTGLPNRRWFMAHLSQELLKVPRTGLLVSVALVDLDHFKIINDQEGHGVGDEALKHVARQLQAQARAGDFVARMGGEEFMVLLQASTIAQAQLAAERFRAGIAAAPFAAPSGPRTLTASVGVALYDVGVSAHRLLRAADLAMYRAKREGRNRVNMVEAESLASVSPVLEGA